MRLRSIWTLPGFPLSERLIRTRDWTAMTVAAHLPKRVRYWCTLQEIGKATMTSHNVPGATVEEILANLDSPAVVR